MLNEPIGGGGGVLSKILLWIAFVELLGYLVFFWVKHKATKGFRKVD
jgi:hypothetical protein